MTPEQMLRRCSPKELNTVLGGPDDGRWTSAAPDEDLHDAIELLLATPGYLIMLQDVDRHYDILSEKARQALAGHISLIEEFTGQWLND